jgi:putative DNA primase/helicase
LADPVRKLREPVEPIPLVDYKAPPISTSLLPTWASEFALAVGEHVQVAPELVIANILGVVATCLSRKFEIVLKPRYREPLNLYILAPLPSGERKSGTQTLCTAPLTEWEQAQARQIREERIEARVRRESLEAIIKSKQGRLGKAKIEDRDSLIAEITQLQKDLPEIPNEPRLLGDDITPEAAAPVMAANNERLGIISAEGGLFDTLAGRYSSGIPNLDLFLKGHSGDFVRVDRKGGAPVMMNAPALTLALSPQPDVMTGLAQKPSFRGRGLLARFAYILPQSMLGQRTFETDPIPASVSAAYLHSINTMLDIPWARNEFGEPTPYVLTLEPDALKEWVEFAGKVEVGLRDGGKFETLRDWAGKLPGLAGRLAGILHCMEHLSDAHLHKVTQPTMANALELGTALTSHAMAAFALIGADPNIEAAKKVLAWIQRGAVEEFTATDCYRSLRGTYPRMEMIRSALGVLEERLHIFPAKVETNEGPGRPPSPAYKVNPLALKGGR